MLAASSTTRLDVRARSSLHTQSSTPQKGQVEGALIGEEFNSPRSFKGD